MRVLDKIMSLSTICRTIWIILSVPLKSRDIHKAHIFHLDSFLSRKAFLEKLAHVVHHHFRAHTKGEENKGRKKDDVLAFTSGV